MNGSNSKILRDYTITIVLAVLLALAIRSFGIEAYRIPSAAMRPALLPGDIIFVAKWPFKLFKNYVPKRGDVIVFEEPNSTGSDYIKRIIGLPGDQVSIRKGHLYLNGNPLIDPKLIQDLSHDPCPDERLPEGKVFPVCLEKPFLENFGPEKVPVDSVFVLGDLRGGDPQGKQKALEKKRKGWGIVPVSALKGKALWIWLSIDPHQAFGSSSSWFPRVRFQRMFKEVL